MAAVVVNALRSHANDLIDVQVGASGVQMRVVIVKRLEINAMSLGHFLAGVVWYDCIYLLTVFAWLRQAQGRARHEIRAFFVNLRIQNHELIEGNALLPAYRVTNLTRLNDVRACARISKNCGGRGRERKGNGNEGGIAHLSCVY